MAVAACAGPDRDTEPSHGTEAAAAGFGAGSGGFDTSTSNAVGGLGGEAGAPSGAAGGSGAVGAGPACEPGAPLWASEVVEISYGPGAGFGQDGMPGIALGPPRGAGCCAGSLDVVTLGDGGSIIVGFSGAAIVDGPGIDFVVFENPFFVGGNPDEIYAEPATVEVSDDGNEWRAFDCTALVAPWGACAGWHPVLLDGPVSSLDPTSCGGDGYDLADVGLEQARYVRIVDRPDVGGAAGTFDLDAVGVVHPRCP